MSFARSHPPEPAGPEAARACKALLDRIGTEGIPAVRDEAWALQRHLFECLSGGDGSVAGPLLSCSRLSFAAEAMAGQALTATSAALIFVSALHALELGFEQRTEPFPEPLQREVQWMAERCCYVAHRSGVPLGACLLAEGLMTRRLGDRMRDRELSAVLARPDARAELLEIRRTLHRLASPADDPSQAAGSVRALRQRVDEMFVADLDTYARAAPREYMFTASTPVHALHGARSTGRSVVYLAPGLGAGAAIRLEAPDTGHELCRSVELPDLSLDAVRTQVRGLRAALRARPAIVKNRVAAVRTALEETARIVWEPLLAAWPDLRDSRLAVIPLGECALLPLYTAPVDGVPACGRMDLTIVPSSRALMLAGSWPAADTGNAFVAADPWFGDSAIRLATREAREVASVYGAEPLILREPEAAGQPAPPAAASPGPAADRLIEGMAAAGLVHIACHGEIDDTTPLQSTLWLGEPRSLAGLLEHNLYPGATVVLSSCHLGGIGTALSGEQLGFPAALLAMGARSVIGALWTVPDSAETTELIVGLHRELAGGGGTAAPPGAAASRAGRPAPSAALGRAIARAARDGVRPTVWAPLTHFGA